MIGHPSARSEPGSTGKAPQIRFEHLKQLARKLGLAKDDTGFWRRHNTSLSLALALADHLSTRQQPKVRRKPAPLYAGASPRQGRVRLRPAAETDASGKVI